MDKKEASKTKKFVHLIGEIIPNNGISKNIIVALAIYLVIKN